MADSLSSQIKLAGIAARQDIDAFSALIAESQPRIRTFLIRLCRDYDSADELAQETFISAFQKLSSFRGSGSFEGWLFRIAYNHFLQSVRSNKRRQDVLEQYRELLNVETDRYGAITDLQIDLERAMSTLNHEEAAAITLCHSFGYSHQEVTDILQAPLGTVKSRIGRGREKLKLALADSLQAADNGVADNNGSMEKKTAAMAVKRGSRQADHAPGDGARRAIND